MSDRVKDRRARAARVNALICEVATRGRKFFSYSGRYSAVNVTDAGRVLWYEAEADEEYDVRRARWVKAHCGGGTLKALCRDLALYVWDGTPVPRHHFGPWPDWYSRGDPWGYGGDMKAVREEVEAMGLLAPREEQR